MLTSATAFHLGSSPLLCAYVMGCVLGNSSKVDADVIARDFSVFNRASEFVVLICLGLVVFPANVWVVKGLALVVFLTTMVGRLAMTFITLHRSSFNAPEKLFPPLWACGVRCRLRSPCMQLPVRWPGVP